MPKKSHLTAHLITQYQEQDHQGCSVTVNALRQAG